MNGRFFQALIFISAAWGGTQPLQWTDNLKNNSMKCVAPGDDLHLLWDFALASDEEIFTMQWFFHGNSEELIGMLVHGSFVPMPAFSQRVQFVPGAGIVVKQVVFADKGNYSVEISTHSGSSDFVDERHTVMVEVAEPPSTDGGDLEVRQDRMAVYDNATDQWSIQLSCGHFTSLGQPPVHVVWTTPSGNTLQSSNFKDGNFHLLITDPVEGDNYTCSLPPQSPAASCLPSSSPLLQNSVVNVRECEAHLAITQAEKTDLQRENEMLKEKESNMTGYIRNLEMTVQNLTQQVHRYNADSTCHGINYTTVDDHTRDESHPDAGLCDKHLVPGWYRFLINGSDAVIPTSCVQDHHCGTDAPVWLDLENGSLPAVGRQTSVNAWASLGAECKWSTTDSVVVRNCGAYLIYQLPGTSGCDLRYCVTRS